MSKSIGFFTLSYNQDDHDWARWVVWQIEETGLRVNFPPPGAHASPPLHEELCNHARGCIHVLALLSPSYLRDLRLHREWAASLSREPTGKGRIYLPVRVRPCAPDPLLCGGGLIDLCGKLEREAAAALHHAVWGMDPGEGPEHTPLPDERRSVLLRPEYPGVPRLRSVPLSGGLPAPGDAEAALENRRLAAALASRAGGTVLPSLSGDRAG